MDGTNVALSRPPPTYDLETRSVEDDSLKTIQYYTPGLLGWAVAMSAAFGAAATLQGWRQSKLIRRLQLAPVSTAHRGGSTGGGDHRHRAGAAGDLRRARRGCVRPAADRPWWMAVPLLVVGTLCFMSIGLLAGALTRTTEGAVNAANFMVLPMSFLSGLVLPARRRRPAGCGPSPTCCR